MVVRTQGAGNNSVFGRLFIFSKDLYRSRKMYPRTKLLHVASQRDLTNRDGQKRIALLLGPRVCWISLEKLQCRICFRTFLKSHVNTTLSLGLQIGPRVESAHDTAAIQRQGLTIKQNLIWFGKASLKSKRENRFS